MMEGGIAEWSDGIGRSSRRDLMIVARQFIAWNGSQSRPSRRVRYDRWDGGSISSGAINNIVASDHSVPYGTDLSCGRVPGNKLPGYDRTVPTGQISFFLS